MGERMAFINRGVAGEISEVRRSGGGELSLDWRIPGFLDLHCGAHDHYDSPQFGFLDARWQLRVWPNWMSAGRVFLDLRRDEDDDEDDSTRRVIFSRGVRGSGGGVEKRREEEEREFEKGRGCYLGCICERSEFLEQEERLVPGGVLTVVCQMRVPGTAATGELPSGVLVTYSYEELQTATQNFGDLPLRDGGCKIGEGGFGTVYRAVVRGDVVAVKMLKDPLDPQFITELKTLTNYKHENLVPLLGCSLGPKCCLLYEYMPNGSLEDRLACNERSEPLSWQTRFSISYGTALGIHHLHTFRKEPEVHRDIKSANILLDQNFVAKVGDFGLVRTGSSGGSTTMAVTWRCSGTPGYMPPEALVGDVSVKWDIFSFGVVLLELLTGLPPYDRNRKDKYLITHMENCKDILRRLDPKAKWNQKAATDLYRITQRCLEQSKRSRPYLSEILEDLRKLSLLR